MYADYAKWESEFDLTGLQPPEAMARLATSILTHLWDNPAWLGLINNENLHQGRYLETSQKLSETISPVVDVVRSILAHGADAGQFRSGIAFRGQVRRSAPSCEGEQAAKVKFF
jgi:hypothetical protein